MGQQMPELLARAAVMKFTVDKPARASQDHGVRPHGEALEPSTLPRQRTPVLPGTSPTRRTHEMTKSHPTFLKSLMGPSDQGARRSVGARVLVHAAGKEFECQRCGKPFTAPTRHRRTYCTACGPCKRLDISVAMGQKGGVSPPRDAGALIAAHDQPSPPPETGLLP